jgi:hypothetical protein
MIHFQFRFHRDSSKKLNWRSILLRALGRMRRAGLRG